MVNRLADHPAFVKKTSWAFNLTFDIVHLRAGLAVVMVGCCGTMCYTVHIVLFRYTAALYKNARKAMLTTLYVGGYLQRLSLLVKLTQQAIQLA